MICLVGKTLKSKTASNLNVFVTQQKKKNPVRLNTGLRLHGPKYGNQLKEKFHQNCLEFGMNKNTERGMNR